MDERCHFDWSGSGCEAFSVPLWNQIFHVAVIYSVIVSVYQFEPPRLDVVVCQNTGPLSVPKDVETAARLLAFVLTAKN